MVEKCSLCGVKQAEGHAWIDDRRYCHGDNVEVTCFMKAQWNMADYSGLSEYLEDLNEC